MSENDSLQIKERLARLEAMMEEKWRSHDTRANERWTDLMDKIHDFSRRIDNRPCVEHGKLMETFHFRIKNTEAWIEKINWAVGVIYIAVIGALVKMFLF